MNTINQYIQLFTFFFLSLVAWSCVDQDFDEPPVRDLPELTANTTIAELKALHNFGADDSEITEDLIIRGIVVADDESGNFFKQLIIEDSTGAIVIRIDENDLFGTFPIGREVFVKCQGLYIGDFNNLVQLQGPDEERIAALLVNNFLVAGARDQQFTPPVFTLEELINSSNYADLISTLVTIEGVEFASASVGQTYADAVNDQSVNHTLQDCDGNTIILRNSGFADFANQPIPGGFGNINAIVSIFGTDRQIFIRDLNDVQLDGESCDGGGGNPDPGADFMDLDDLRTMFESGTAEGPDGAKIKGVVVSDVANGNWNGQNMVIQDGTGGVTVRFSDFHSFTLGQEVEVDISGQELSEFNGLFQVNNVPLANVINQTTGTLPEPKTVTISEIVANLETYESTVVRIENIAFQDSGTFGNEQSLSDGTGTIVTFTRNSASFFGQALPSGNFTLTAVVSEFNGPQITIRNDGDF